MDARPWGTTEIFNMILVDGVAAPVETTVFGYADLKTYFDAVRPMCRPAMERNGIHPIQRVLQWPASRCCSLSPNDRGHQRCLSARRPARLRPGSIPGPFWQESIAFFDKNLR
jgi:hypothetical protein